MSALLIDVGNSRLKWRMVDATGEAIGDHAAIGIADLHGLVDQWQSLRPDLAVVSNVAGERVGSIVDRALRSLAADIRIEHVVPVREAAGVINGYRDVAQLGPDRWLAMIGAHALWPDRSLLVCNLGTATTIDLLSMDAGDARATFIGGMILPGVDTMRNALARDTARLAVNPGRIVDFADNTDDAIASGIALAQVGAIDAALRHAASRLTSHNLACVVSGGASGALLQALETIDVAKYPVADLVLRGLAVLARHMRGERRMMREATVTVR